MPSAADFGGMCQICGSRAGEQHNERLHTGEPDTTPPPPLQWWWLSFAAHKTPDNEGSRFLGCAIVGPARTGGEALELAHTHGFAPTNGEVEAEPMPKVTRVALRDTFRLLSRDEATEVFGAADVRRLLAKFKCPRHGDGCATHAANEVDMLRETRRALLEMLVDHPEARAWLPAWVRPRVEAEKL